MCGAISSSPMPRSSPSTRFASACRTRPIRASCSACKPRPAASWGASCCGSPIRACCKLAQQLAEDYDFDGIELTLPNVSFDERYELNLDGVDVHLIHVGPSHQWGDTIIHIPAERVVFSGDVVFRQCTPMGWSGTYERWIKNLEFIESLAPEVIMPGHGPLCGLEGPREMKAYLQYMDAESRRSFDQGLSEAEAARRIDFGPYDAWRAPARLYFNVARAYREFRGEPHDAPWNIPKMFAGMYRVAKARGLEIEF